jgi:hypothetical protein
MIAVLIGFIVVLVQFNLMVNPVCITAFSLNTGEKGVCQIEFLGEKTQLTMPDPELLINRGVLGRQMLTENAYQALESGGRVASQVWVDKLKALPLGGEFERLLNTFKTSGPLHLREWLQSGRGDGR